MRKRNPLPESAKNAASEFPSSEQIERELNKMNYQRASIGAFRSTVFTLIVVASVAVLIAVLLLPVLRIYGHSMNNTLEEGDIVVSLKGSSFASGDIVAFYYNNKILVKRVVGVSGDWINIDAEGNVFVNNVPLDEPYLIEKALGETNIELPYQVPANRIFVMGDNRDVSIDSRNTSVGCVAEEQVVGKIVFRVWPLRVFGRIR